LLCGLECIPLNASLLKRRRTKSAKAKTATECMVKTATDVKCESEDGDTEKYTEINVKKLYSLKHCVRIQITCLKLQKSFYDLEHGVLSV